MIYVLVRHCTYSKASAGKNRPANFRRVDLFQKLLDSLKEALQAKLIVLLDANEKHFVEDFPVEIHKKVCGSEAKSFLEALDIVEKSGWKDDDIVVFLEDDYAVSPNWIGLIEEGLGFADYVTLYDHPDKYSEMYSKLVSTIYLGKRRHWRTTPSTTNSYAARVKTLRQDMQLHRDYSRGFITNDHQKFMALWGKGKSLVSCIPSAWSHEETGMQAHLL